MRKLVEHTLIILTELEMQNATPEDVIAEATHGSALMVKTETKQIDRPWDHPELASNDFFNLIPHEATSFALGVNDDVILQPTYTSFEEAIDAADQILQNGHPNHPEINKLDIEARDDELHVLANLMLFEKQLDHE